MVGSVTTSSFSLVSGCGLELCRSSGWHKLQLLLLLYTPLVVFNFLKLDILQRLYNTHLSFSSSKGLHKGHWNTFPYPAELTSLQLSFVSGTTVIMVVGPQ